MWLFFLLVYIGLPVWLIVSAIRRGRRIRTLEQDTKRHEASLTALQSRLALLEAGAARTVANTAPVSAAVASVAPAAVVPFAPVAVAVSDFSSLTDIAMEVPADLMQAEAVTALMVDAASDSSSPALRPGAATAQPPASSVLEQRWQRFARLFIENWTGILGAAVLVSGVAFLGIYAALEVSPFLRFLMMVGGAGILFALSRFTGRRSEWQALAQWLRSAAAAVLLFACAGSGALPGLGLQWLHEPLPALLLLFVGLCVNLAAAWITREQAIATLHVLLSLLPLLFVSPTPVSLGLGAAVAACGLVLALRQRWDLHVLLVLAAYALFQVAWHQQLDAASMGLPFRLAGGLCALAVFAAAVLVHYRRADASSPTPALSLTAHLLAWSLLAGAVFAYIDIAWIRALILAVTAMAAWMLGHHARGLDQRWLHLSDILIGQALLLAAIFSAFDWLQLGDSLWLLVMLAEFALFLRLMLDEDEPVLVRVAWLGTQLVAVMLAVVGLTSLSIERDAMQPVSNDVFVLLAGAALLALLQAYLHARRLVQVEALAPYGAGLNRSVAANKVFGWFCSLLLCVGLLRLFAHSALAPTALCCCAALFWAARRWRDTGLLVAATVGLLFLHLLLWPALPLVSSWPVFPLSLRWLPMSALAALPLWLADRAGLRTLAVGLLAADIGLGAYLYLEPASSLLPGVAWLMLSLLILELANRTRTLTRITLYAGYAYLLAFAVHYAIVVLQSQSYLGGVPVRLLIEAFAMGVLAYWWTFRPREPLAGEPFWQRVQPLALEAALLLLTSSVLADVATEWRPVVWALLALLFGSRPAARLGQRCALYGMVFFWISVAAVAFVMTGFNLPAASWFESPDTLSLLALILQAFYIGMHLQAPVPQAGIFPVGLKPLAKLAEQVGRKPHLWLLYPFFAGVALFLFWRFDRTLLTVLWSAEAFVLFCLSVWLREGQLRYVALAALGTCMLRLLLVDMAQSNLGMRGVVFLGVGLLMLGMNAIYARYKTRFE